MKNKIYPNYTDLYYKVSDKAIEIRRRCFDGVTRYINTLRFNSAKECTEYWENNCGA